MKVVDISLSEFREKLRGDPRIQKEYIENVELPQAFASGNKFLKKLILENVDIDRTHISSAWFEFSQMIEDIQVNRKSLRIKYDSEKGTHPPLLSEKYGP